MHGSLCHRKYYEWWRNLQTSSRSELGTLQHAEQTTDRINNRTGVSQYFTLTLKRRVIEITVHFAPRKSHKRSKRLGHSPASASENVAAYNQFKYGTATIKTCFPFSPLCFLNNLCVLHTYKGQPFWGCFTVVLMSSPQNILKPHAVLMNVFTL